MRAALTQLAEKALPMPSWAIQSVLGLLLTGFITWATWATTTANAHTVRLSVAETKIDEVKQNIADIKDSQKTIEHKLDRILERQNGFRSTH